MAPDVHIDKILVGLTHVYYAPFGTAEVADTIPFEGNWGVNWAYVGAVNEGVTQNFERDLQNHYVENIPSEVDVTVNTSSLSYAMALAEYTLENMKVANGGGTITEVAATATTPRKRRLRFSNRLDKMVLGMEGRSPDDGSFYRWFVPKVISAESVETEHRRSENKSVLPVTFRAICDMEDVHVDEIFPLVA